MMRMHCRAWLGREYGRLVGCSDYTSKVRGKLGNDNGLT